MRIDSSVIGMESERSYSAKSARATKIVITEVRQGLTDGTGSLYGNLLQPKEEGTTQAKENKESENYVTNIWEEMRSKLENYQMDSTRIQDLREAEKQLSSIRQQCLNYLMQLFFPDRRKSTEYDSSVEVGGEGVKAQTNQSTDNKGLTVVGSNMRTFTFSRQYYYEESETTSFSTQGTVTCADGREINFNLNLEMSRSFQEYYEENYFSVEASLYDPLVINLDGNIAELSDQTFFFDIDGDGEEDEINKLSAASGYLALDQNGDGIINDGSELFGTKSGDGFADLAAYDEDGNGFLDEGDKIFEKLKIWIMDENGNSQLVSLKEKGVGAICLKNAATDFTLTGTDNHTKGMIRKTGFFLYENGAVGSVQHVDIAKYDQAG